MLIFWASFFQLADSLTVASQRWKKKHITHGKTSCHHSGYVGCGAQSKSDFDKQIDQHLEAVIASW